MNEPTTPAAPPDGQDEIQLAGLPRNIAAHLQSLRTNMQTKAEAKAEASEQTAPLWGTLSRRLQAQIGEATYRRWFEPITASLSAERPYCLQLAFPTRFKRDWIEQHYGDLIRILWREMEPDGTIHLASMPQTKVADEKPKKAQIINLPTFPTETRAVVNEIARSALFAAIQGKDRQWLKDVPVALSGDGQILFSGEQLNQADHDVFMQLISVGSVRPAGEYVIVTGYSLLKALGRGTGKSQHDQLEAEIKRLVDGSVSIKAKRFTYFGHLIHDAKKDEESGYWVFRLNENLLPLFGVNCYTLIDWDQRKKLKGDLARWLQLEIASHAKPFPAKVETLHRLSGSRTKDMRSFRQTLRKALDTLQAAGYIKAWHIDEADLVHVDRGETISDSQRRHLAPPKLRRRR